LAIITIIAHAQLVIKLTLAWERPWNLECTQFRGTEHDVIMTRKTCKCCDLPYYHAWHWWLQLLWLYHCTMTLVIAIAVTLSLYHDIGDCNCCDFITVPWHWWLQLLWLYHCTVTLVIAIAVTLSLYYAYDIGDQFICLCHSLATVKDN